jgi:hypothetical protein
MSAAVVLIVVVAGSPASATAGGGPAPEARHADSAGITPSVTAPRPPSTDAATAPSTRKKCNTRYGTYTLRALTSQAFHWPRLSINSYGAADLTCSGDQAARTLNTIAVAGDGPAIDIEFNITVFESVQGETIPAHQPADRQPICSTTAPGRYTPTGPSGKEWTIELRRPCIVPDRLNGQVVWLEVQADLDYRPYGRQWFWATQSLTRTTKPADWRNPENTFDTDCITYSSDAGGADVGPESLLNDCLSEGFEFMFRIVD